MGDYEGLNVMVLLGFTLCFAMKAQNSSQTLKKKQNWRNEERREACKEMYPQGVRHVYGLEVILWVGSTAISFLLLCAFSLPSYNVARPRITHKCLIDRFLWESLLPLHFCIWCFLFFLVFRSFCLSSLLHSFNFFLFFITCLYRTGCDGREKKKFWRMESGKFGCFLNFNSSYKVTMINAILSGATYSGRRRWASLLPRCLNLQLVLEIPTLNAWEWSRP